MIEYITVPIRYRLLYETPEGRKTAFRMLRELTREGSSIWGGESSAEPTATQKAATLVMAAAARRAPP